jgi:hypothetical protein
MWLERALQLDDQMFESLADAQDAVDDLSGAGTVQSRLASRALPPVQSESEVGSPGAPAAPEPAEVLVHSEPEHDYLGDLTLRPGTPVRDPERQAHVPEPLHDPQLDERETVAVVARQSGSTPVSLAVPSPPVSALEEQPWPGSSLFTEIHPLAFQSHVASPAGTWAARRASGAAAPARGYAAMPQLRTRSLGGPVGPPKRSTDRLAATSSKALEARRGAIQSLAAALALCVMGEGFVIARLVQRRGAVAPPTILVQTVDPGADVLVDGRSAGVTPLQLNLGVNTRSIRVVGPRAHTSNAEDPAPEPRRAVPAKLEVRRAEVVPPAPQRSGGIRLVSPIDVDVFEGDRRLGSSATGIVSAAAGRRELELVNTRLGYRAREIVEVRGGQVVTLTVSPPAGRLSINAVPWAEVWIDGKSVGETPLGNLSVPLGEHEILFRHPQLGERRQTALVRLDVVTRVSANLQR